MKNLLIIFIVLLFLLTLLSSFGGSIKVSEPFYDATPAYNSIEHFAYDVPNPPTYATFSHSDEPETFYQHTPGHDSDKKDLYSLWKSKEERFYNEDGTSAIAAPPPSFVPESTQIGSQPTPLTAEVRESFANVQKIDIPEPFVDADTTTGAPF